MNGQAPALEAAMPRRPGLLLLFAVFFTFAQLLFAAHADDLSSHAPQSCEFCLAAAIAEDPTSLEAELAAPVVSIARVRQPVAADVIVERALRAASPRGPPNF